MQKKNICQSIIAISICMSPFILSAQSLAINTDGSPADISAMLDIKSSNKGLLIPRVTKAEKNAIATPASGLLIYQTGPDSTGFHYYNGANWQFIGSSASGWSLTGNSGNTSSNFLGTLDAQPLRFRVNNTTAGYIATNGNVALGLNAAPAGSGTGNSAIGQNALTLNAGGINNTATGGNSLASNTSGSNNTAMGYNALQLNNAGVDNTAIGNAALSTNNNGSSNIAFGRNALNSNNTGSNNAAVGTSALFSNLSSDGNTAVGASSGYNNITGQYNVFAGYEAGYNNDTSYNVFAGYRAGYSSTRGYNNTFIGKEAGRSNTIGNSNTAIGNDALRSSLTATHLVAIGDSALHSNTAGFNVAVGSKGLLKNISGNQNIAIGYQSLAGNLSASDNIAIGTSALLNNRAGGRNIAIGTQALQAIQNAGSTFSYNVAIGYRSLFTAATGSNQNVIVGSFAGDASIGVSNNVFVGFSSGSTLQFGVGNTFVGHGSGSSPLNGNNNTAIGYGSSITSGNENSTALGYGADVIQSNSMVFGNSDVIKWGFATNATAGNILEFNSALTTARLTIGGVWTNASDRNLKTNFSTLNGTELLQKIKQLPVTRWSYIKEGNAITHIGPMAQDFYNLFAVGQDDKTISSIDPAGVALAGIQQLVKENEKLKKQLADQLKMIKALQKAIAR